MTWVKDGREAFETFKVNKFETVQMDVQMPVMNGIDATRAIRQFEKETHLSEIPIIALTAVF